MRLVDSTFAKNTIERNDLWRNKSILVPRYRNFEKKRDEPAGIGSPGRVVAFHAQPNQEQYSKSLHNTLKNIAEALHVPLFQFFKDDARGDKLIVHKGDNLIIGRVGEEVLYKLLTPDISGAIEFCLMEIPAGTAFSDVPREHTGEEVAYIISGEVDLYLNGTVYHLADGDSVRILPMSNHRWVNHSDSEFKVVFATTPPSF